MQTIVLMDLETVHDVLAFRGNRIAWALSRVIADSISPEAVANILAVGQANLKYSLYRVK